MKSFIFAFLVAVVAFANALSRSNVLKPFAEGNAFKVISGLNNFDATNVNNVVAAACSCGGKTQCQLREISY